ncbi:MAG TPA: AMP-binding protein [Candidatus Angelobacter sp.]
MDLRKLSSHIAEKKHQNVIITFEKGKVVKRDHQTFYADVMAACTWLKECGVQPGTRIGIWACNCYEWIIYDLALLDLRALSVAFTDDFAHLSADELIDKYSLSLLLVPSSEKHHKAAAQSSAVAFLDGENKNIRAIPRAAGPADWEFKTTGLVFSPASSGRLKGLTLWRQGIEASVDAFTQRVQPLPDDCLLLFLPISNFQQRLMYYSALWYGFDLIVTDPTRLFRALKDLHPTILIAPPMLYEAFENRFYNLPTWKRWAALSAGSIIRMLPSQSLRARLARMLFKDAYEALGGKMRFMVTGMAGIKKSTLELFRLMQLPLYETYGMTEFGGIALNVPGDSKLGSVGRLLPGVRVELAPDGEVIAIREHRIASTYFECADGEAEQTFISQDRVATGDIGRFDKDGYLYLIGRKKEMIVTSGGNKVHPELPEAEIDACPDVARSVVFAHEDSPNLVAVVLPKKLEDVSVRIRIQQFVDQLNERKPFLTVDAVIFSDQAFSRENGFLRPNLKLDRKKIAQHFLNGNGNSGKTVARSA